MTQKRLAKPTSDKKIEANRRNAKRSTGPLTAEGKAKAARNSLKHGILAKSVVVPSGPAAEKAEEFEALVAELEEDLEPQGALEGYLVSQIAILQWRLRRVTRSEAYEIARALTERAEDRDREGAQDVWAKVLSADYGADFKDPFKPDSHGRAYAIAKTTQGSHLLLRLLHAASDSLNHWLASGSARPLTADEWHHFAHMFDGRLGTERATRLLDPNRDTEDPSTGEVEALLSSIVREIPLVQAGLTRARERDALETNSVTVPDSSAGEKLLRYEKNVQLQLHRSIRQLRLVQDRRALKQHSTGPDTAP